jgi:hypothetical protein
MEIYKGYEIEEDASGYGFNAWQDDAAIWAETVDELKRMIDLEDC